MESSQRLAATMFTDIVGDTALIGADQGAALRLLSKNSKMHKSTIEKFNGVWLKEMGNGTLASFNTSSEAVRCARVIQDKAKEENIC
jgi:class 3 adenylate cyclase